MRAGGGDERGGGEVASNQSTIGRRRMQELGVEEGGAEGGKGHVAMALMVIK